MICVVTSTHFSIGAGERSDARSSSDALWEGEEEVAGLEGERLMGEDQEVGLGEAGDFEAHSGTKIGTFPPPAASNQVALRRGIRSRKMVLDRTGLKLRETTSQARLVVRAEA